MNAARSPSARPRRIYLDWNATTPPHPCVIESMLEAARSNWGNPSSVHAFGREARAVVDRGREVIGEAIGGCSRDVIFTSGATEANNLALRDAAALVTSRLEHPSVTRVAELLEQAGRPVRWLPVPETGRLRGLDVDDALGDLPAGAVVAVMAANHETGVVQPIAEIADRVHARGGRLHVDAAQGFGKWSASDWASADSLSIAAHKIRGPKGIGALIWRTGTPPAPVLVGGAQERGIRPGTVDPILIAGFTAAARAAGEGPQRYRSVEPLRDRLERSVAPVLPANVSSAPRLPHVASLRAPGWRGDELVAALDLEGISVSSGSACSAGTAEPPRAIEAMLGSIVAHSTIRVSLGDATPPEDIDELISVLLRLVGPGARQS